MSEDLFEVYKRIGDYSYRLASNMDIYNAVLFMQAWMQENYADQSSSLELRRQPYEEEGESHEAD